MKGIKNRAAAWVLNHLVFTGSYISLFSFCLCIYQVKGLSHCSISAVPGFTAKQGNMAINLISCCCRWNTAPMALLSELHPSQADIKENKTVCNKREQQTFLSKWWFLNCMARMPFFGKARFFKWSVYRTPDRICEKRGQSAPAAIPVSPSPRSWQEPEWAKATGAASLVSDPTVDEVDELQILVRL